MLSLALVLSTLAGVAVEKRLAIFALLPALLVLQPASVSSTGALGGILSSRISTNLHLGLVEPTLMPGRPVLNDAALVGALAVPILGFNAIGAQILATLLDQASPGLWWMLAVSMCAGLVTMVFVAALAYYGTIAAWRVDLDPDSVGIPVVTASVDFVGVVCLVAAVAAFGLI